MQYTFEWEQYEAAESAGYTMREYRQLSGTEKSEVIARYRTKKQYDAVVTAVEIRHRKLNPPK